MLANLCQADLDKYEMNLKIYRDYKNTIDTAFDEGKIKRTVEIIKSAKLMGLSVQDISKLTGLSEGEIDKL